MGILELVRNLEAKKRRLFWIIIGFSLLIKVFYLVTQSVIAGLDASEYQYLTKLIQETGFEYLSSSDPFTFWRLPFLPFVIFICRNYFVFFSFQLFISYFLARDFYLIFLRLTKDTHIALLCFYTVLFLPYINSAACKTLSEFFQIFLITYSFRKTLYRQFDYKLVIALSCACLLRPEIYFFVLLIIARELFSRKYNALPKLSIPLLFVIIWMVRNQFVFGAFALVNPVLAPRALIGSVYGQIYYKSNNDFHVRYDYYEGRDYINNKEFIEKYKKVVREEVRRFALTHPLDFIIARFKQIAYAFSYVGLNAEVLPDSSWKFHPELNFYARENINSQWSYSNLFQTKDFLRLLLRLIYNGILCLCHLAGLVYLVLNRKILSPLFFIFLSFWFILFVEADMRYFITIQSFSFCCAAIMFYRLAKHKSFYIPILER